MRTVSKWPHKQSPVTLRFGSIPIGQKIEILHSGAQTPKGGKGLPWMRSHCKYMYLSDYDTFHFLLPVSLKHSLSRIACVLYKILYFFQQIFNLNAISN